MADPLLNTLCSICHTSTPKYTCPGCGTHTCSLACNKKHKSWANCSGRRDPTAYMPPSRLKTAAGIDHDYNFLSAIERERERNQREIVDERGLFTQKELGSQLDDPFSFRKQWFGDDVRFHPVGGSGGGGGGGPRMFASDGEDSGEDGAGDGAEARHNRRNIPAKASQLTQRVRQRLAAEDVRVVQMPVGMTRQRENTTMWNRKARRINWCVEWILYEDSGSGDEGGLGKKHTRIRHNALETTPLYRALGNSMAWHKKGQRADEDAADDDEDMEPARAGAGRRKRVLIREVKEAEQRGGGGVMQDGGSAAWHPRTQYPTQSPLTGAWSSDAGATTASWDADAEVEARRRHRFYLLRPLTAAGGPRELIPVSAAEDLGAALAGRTVLEYPTIYVLPPAPPLPAGPAASSTAEAASPPPPPLLPEGHILGSTERRRPPKRQQQQQAAAAATKRKAAPGSRDDPTSRQQPSQKRQAISGGGGGAGEAGRQAQRGRGKATTSSSRGRGRAGRGGAGRPAPGRRHGGAGDPDPDAEEGEVNSDGDEVVAAAAAGRADTSSSDPDSSSSSSDDDDDGQDGGSWRGPPHRPRGGGGMDVDDDDDEGAGNNNNSSNPRNTTQAAQARGNGTKKSSGMGLVDYGSDSSGEEEEGGSEEEEDDGDADPATLKPENPELVAGAIQEIVGLLS